MSYVYFMESGPLIKIGHSKDPASRVYGVSSEYKRRTRLVAVIETVDACNLERRLHHRFRKQAIAKEWFKLSPSQVTWLRHFFEQKGCPIPKRKPVFIYAPIDPKVHKQFREWCKERGVTMTAELTKMIRRIVKGQR